MNKLFKVLTLPLLVISLSGCDLIDDIFGGDNSETHTKSYEPITGKFVLYDHLDKRYSYTDTYFEINGSKDNFSLKYYENGKLKKEGKIAKLLTRLDDVGKWSDNLHFNVQIDSRHYDHISCYTESFEPLNQFRIIDEYYNPTLRYYLSELPYVLGTYVREGASFVEEKPNTNEIDYMIPTIDHFTCAIDGKYALDDKHYFYFLNTHGFTIPDGSLFDSYFQYYSPSLDKPIEGFISGFSYDYSNTIRRATFNMKTLRESVDWGKGTEGRISFGYSDFDEEGNMIDHSGSIEFTDGELKSFTFEHLSRHWSDDEWNDFLKHDTKLPDPILYEYQGGTYSKVR